MPMAISRETIASAVSIMWPKYHARCEKYTLVVMLASTLGSCQVKPAQQSSVAGPVVLTIRCPALAKSEPRYANLALQFTLREHADIAACGWLFEAKRATP